MFINFFQRKNVKNHKIFHQNRRLFSFRAKQMIRDAVQKNDFLKQLAKEQIIELVNCMYEMRARAGQWVIQEGEPGDRLFVVAGQILDVYECVENEKIAEN